MEETLIMPNAPEIEKAVIGALLLEKAAYPRVSHVINENLFYNDTYRKIFLAIKHLYENGSPVDLLTVTNRLLEKKEDVTPYDVAVCSTEVVSTIHLEYHVDILTEKARRREGILLADKLAKAASDNVEQFTKELSSLKCFIEEKTSSENLSDILKDPTEDEFLSVMSSIPEGVPMMYDFTDENGTKKQLVIPSGALTFVCAPTSHGKSTLLRNLALDMSLQTDREGRVLYFTFEESARDLWAQFLNLYIGKDLHKETKEYNNLSSIKRYFTQGESAMEKWSYEAKRFFPVELKNFKEKVICLQGNSGNLKVINKDLDLSELVESVEFYCRAMEQQDKKVKAVFLDYVQLLNVKGSKSSRKEELVEVCKELMNLSIKIGIPFVLAAQLNRETKSPLALFNQNISDASDIEKCANLIICLWNSNQEAQDASYYGIGGRQDANGNFRQGRINVDARKLEDRGFFAGGARKYFDNPSFNATPIHKRSTIYAKITKYRGDKVGMDAILNWNPNTGVIEKNHNAQAQYDLPFLPQNEAATILD